MTVRSRYTYLMKARHLATLARMACQSALPIVQAAAGAARIILTRRYIDRQEKP